MAFGEADLPSEETWLVKIKAKRKIVDDDLWKGISSGWIRHPRELLKRCSSFHKAEGDQVGTDPKLVG